MQSGGGPEDGHTRAAGGRARSLAVALAVAAGVVATVATSPAPEPPCPLSSTDVSTFYGVQDVDDGGEAWRRGGWFEVGPFIGGVDEVRVPDCVAEHTDDDGMVPVTVVLTVTDDGSGLGSFLDGTVLVDGDGHRHTVSGVEIGETEGSRNDVPVREARLVFALPLDAAVPVVLQLPTLKDRRNALTSTVPLGPSEPATPAEPDEVEPSPTQTQRP